VEDSLGSVELAQRLHEDDAFRQRRHLDGHRNVSLARIIYGHHPGDDEGCLTLRRAGRKVAVLHTASAQVVASTGSCATGNEFAIQTFTPAVHPISLQSRLHAARRAIGPTSANEWTHRTRADCLEWADFASPADCAELSS
jgi:hypothetical protein